MPKKSKPKPAKVKPASKKEEFVLSDEELDQVSGGTATVAGRAVEGRAKSRAITRGGTVMEPYGSGSGGSPAPYRAPRGGQGSGY